MKKSYKTLFVGGFMTVLSQFVDDGERSAVCFIIESVVPGVFWSKRDHCSADCLLCIYSNTVVQQPN